MSKPETSNKLFCPHCSKEVPLSYSIGNPAFDFWLDPKEDIYTDEKELGLDTDKDNCMPRGAV